MSADSKQAFRSAFLRMERDAELVARFETETGDKVISYNHSTALDDLVWDRAKLRRRLVEDEA